MKKIRKEDIVRVCPRCGGKRFIPKFYPNGREAIVGDPCPLCRAHGYYPPPKKEEQTK